jgi:Spy/CpxP family protein refolding chaperone
MYNKLARLLPIFALVFAVPTFTIVAGANAADLSSIRPVKNARSIAQAQPGQIDLTAEQKAKIQQIRQSTRTKIEAVLNPEQLKKFQQIQQQAQLANGGITNVTADQKAKVQNIDRTAEEKMLAVLTPEQQSQLKQGGQKKGGPQNALTSEQKAKIEQIAIARRGQIEAILTPEQKSQNKADEERIQSLQQALKSLKSTLTPDQQTKITAIEQSSSQQLKSIVLGQQPKPKTSK